MRKSPVYGGRCGELLANFDQESSSWKMLEMCFEWGDETWLDRLPKSGMTVNGQLYRLDNLEHHTFESAGFVLPTPTAQQRQSPKRRKIAIQRAKNNIHLTKRHQKDGKNVEGDRLFTLEDTLIYHMILPTPTCHDSKNNMSPSCWTRQADLGVEIAKMEGYNQETIIGTGLRIHPHFVEWMMGFPIGWLD